MEKKIVICGSCGHSQEIEGHSIKGYVYFPDRKVYCDDRAVVCPNHSRSTNMVVFGENYISPLFIDYDTYLSDKTIVDSNIMYYEKMIEKTENPQEKAKYIDKLESYKESVYHYHNPS